MEGFATPSVSSAAAPLDGVAAPEKDGKFGKKDKDKGAGKTQMGVSMGCGALVADRQKNWPTSFDFSKPYLHLDELFLHNAPVEYENNDGDIVKLSPSKTPGRLEFTLNCEPKPDVTELRFDASSGRLEMQEEMPLGSSVDSRSVIPLKDRDRVIYLLSWLAQSSLVPGLPECEEPLAYALLLLEKPVMCPLGSLLIASKLDFDINSPTCRMALFGRILTQMDPKDKKSLKLVKMKSKTGMLDRVDKQDSSLLICRDMFTAETDMSLFTGLKIVHENTGSEGILEGTFGQEGKFKVRFKNELRHIKTNAKLEIQGEERITLYFKKNNFDQHCRKIVQ